MLLGGAALALVALLRGGRLRLARGDVAVLAIGALGVAAYQAAFFSGVARLGVAVGTLVAIGSAPLLAGLWQRERPTRAWLAATALCVAGAALLLAQEARVDALGVLFALAAAASYVAYSVAAKRLVATGPPDATMAAMFLGGALLLAPVLVVGDLAFAATPRGALAVAHLGLVATALAYALYARGLAGTRVATAATLALAEPLTAALLGTLVLGERLAPQGWAGAALILTGLVVLVARPAK